MNAMQQWLTEVKMTNYSDTHIVLKRGSNSVSICKGSFGSAEFVTLNFRPAGNSSIYIELTLAAESLVRAIAAKDMTPAFLADWIEENPECRMGGSGDSYILPFLRHCLNNWKV